MAACGFAVHRQAAIHFLPLGLRERGLLGLGGDAVPARLDQPNPLSDAEPVDS